MNILQRATLPTLENPALLQASLHPSHAFITGALHNLLSAST